MRSRTAFTLVELLVVVAIIAVLIALLLAAVQRTRESANRTECANNLKQLGVALHAFSQVQGTLPPGYESFIAADGSDLGPGWGWGAFLLPYLEQSPLYDSIELSLDVQDATNARPRVTFLSV